MNEFESELRKALCRREPPEGFADRVMSRIPARRTRPTWLGAVAAALIVVLVGIGLLVQDRERQRRIAAERAKAELIYALQVTTSGLETAKAMLQRQAEGRKL